MQFKVAATGTRPLSYEWFFNQERITGSATTTLTLSNVQPAQAGQYFVIVSNVGGSAQSSNAALSVLVTPTLGIDMAPGSPEVAISFNSVLGQTYTLEFSDSLLGIDWMPLISGVPGTGKVITLRDTNAPPLCIRFYRISSE